MKPPLTLETLCIKTPPREDEHLQCYNIGCRAYYLEMSVSGDITLHPVHTFVANRSTGVMAYIDVYFLGDRTPGKPWQNKSQRIYDLEPGDVIKCPWSPSEDAERFPFGGWQYSPLAAEEIQKCTYTSTRPDLGR